ncbi:MAG: hypothetical protein ACXW2I_02080 [Burkholderiales bacterium]
MTRKLGTAEQGVGGRGLRMRRPALPVAIGVCLAFAGCAMPWPKPPAQIDDIYEHSTYELTGSAEAAASCIVQNASKLGFTASVQPLYGTSAMAVSVRTLPAGGQTIATLSILSEGRRSRATITIVRAEAGDRRPAVERLVKGC